MQGDMGLPDMLYAVIAARSRLTHRIFRRTSCKQVSGVVDVFAVESPPEPPAKFKPLYSEITFDKGSGRARQCSRLSLRQDFGGPKVISVYPTEQNFEVPMGRIGQPAVPPFMPALTHAIFAATWRRIHTLPVRDQF